MALAVYVADIQPDVFGFVYVNEEKAVVYTSCGPLSLGRCQKLAGLLAAGEERLGGATVAGGALLSGSMIFGGVLLSGTIVSGGTLSCCTTVAGAAWSLVGCYRMALQSLA